MTPSPESQPRLPVPPEAGERTPATGATRWRRLFLPLLPLAALVLGALYVFLLPVLGAALILWTVALKLTDLVRHARRGEVQRA